MVAEEIVGNDQLTGPLINEVVEPPEIAVGEVLVTDMTKAFVFNLPFVNVSDFIVLALFRVTPFALLTITPPVPLKPAENSVPVVWAVIPLYCKVAPEPYIGAVPEVVADPSRDSTPFTVVPVVVLMPVPVRVRLLYFCPEIV